MAADKNGLEVWKSVSQETHGQEKGVAPKNRNGFCFQLVREVFGEESSPFVRNLREERFWPSEENSYSVRMASPGRKKRRHEVSTTLAASRRAESEKNRWICNTKLFSDVNVFCGLDRRVVKTSRLFLCGLSKYLCKVFLDHSSFYSEEIALILPDMDSATLSDFLKNVCSGRNNLAKVDKSLKFLGFGNVAF